MVNNPLTHIEEWLTHTAFKRAIIHIEADCDITNMILQTKEYKKECTLAISPGTPLDRLATFANHVSRFLVMGVNPGASGQSFLGEPILARVQTLQKLYPHHVIAVDGGISPTTIPLLRKAGAHAACASSAIWQKDIDPITAYKRLTFL
jgi:ribulose-phosphate 3-epimerase